MKKIILQRTFIVVLVVSILVFSFIRVNTLIYVGDYFFSPGCVDIQITIDDKLILNDSLHSFPYYPIILTEKLRYGYHKVNLASKKVNLNQEFEIFLLPNQHIAVEFLGMDTLYFKNKDFVHSSNNKIRYRCFSPLDSIKFFDQNQSRFIIKCSFNPFGIKKKDLDTLKAHI